MSRAALALLLVACSSAPGPQDPAPRGAAQSAAFSVPAPRACTETAPRLLPATVHALPDDGDAPFVDAIATARKSLRIMAYQMGYGPILDAIVAKAQAGVAVKVILDGVSQLSVNQKYKSALEAAGAEVHWSDPAFPYMHAKTIVIDDTLAIVSTSNFLESFLLKERNFMAVDADPQDVSDLGALFDADFAQQAPALDCTRLLVSPVNSKGRIVGLIESATKSVLVESMELGDWDVRKALVARHAAGVDVRVLLAAPSWISANTSAGDAMKAAGIDARWLGSPPLHVKAIVVDGERAYMGSVNLSSSSLTKNREVGLVITEDSGVATIDQTIEADYQLATPF